MIADLDFHFSKSKKMFHTFRSRNGKAKESKEERKESAAQRHETKHARQTETRQISRRIRQKTAAVRVAAAQSLLGSFQPTSVQGLVGEKVGRTDRSSGSTSRWSRLLQVCFRQDLAKHDSRYWRERLGESYGGWRVICFLSFVRSL